MINFIFKLSLIILINLNCSIKFINKIEIKLNSLKSYLKEFKIQKNIIITTKNKIGIKSFFLELFLKDFSDIKYLKKINELKLTENKIYFLVNFFEKEIDKIDILIKEKKYDLVENKIKILLKIKKYLKDIFSKEKINFILNSNKAYFNQNLINIKKNLNKEEIDEKFNELYFKIIFINEKIDKIFNDFLFNFLRLIIKNKIETLREIEKNFYFLNYIFINKMIFLIEIILDYINDEVDKILNDFNSSIYEILID